MFLSLSPKPALLVAVPQRGDSGFSSSQYFLKKQQPKRGPATLQQCYQQFPVPLFRWWIQMSVHAGYLYSSSQSWWDNKGWSPLTQGHKHLLPHCPLSWCWLQKDLPPKLDCSCYWRCLQWTCVVIQLFFSLKCDCKKKGGCSLLINC